MLLISYPCLLCNKHKKPSNETVGYILFFVLEKKTEAKNHTRIGHFAMISYNVIYVSEILT